MTLPMWILAVITIFAGFQAGNFFNFLGLKLEEIHTHLEYLPLIVSILGIALAWTFYQGRYFSADNAAKSLSPIYMALEKKFWIDDVYIWIYRNILDGLSIVCGWFDRYIVDGLVNFIAYYTMRASQRLRRIQSGRAQDYLYGIIIAILLFYALSLLTPHLNNLLTTRVNSSEISVEEIQDGLEYNDE